MNNKPLRLIIFLISLACAAAVYAQKQGNADSAEEYSPEYIGKIFFDAMDRFEEKNPDMMDYVSYDVMADGSTVLCRQILCELDNDEIRESAIELNELFDKIYSKTRGYNPDGNMLQLQNKDIRLLRFKSHNDSIDKAMRRSGRYDKYDSYQQFIAIQDNNNGYRVVQSMCTDPDKSYIRKGDFSDLDREFANMIDADGSELKKVRFGKESYTNGVLRVRPNPNQSVEGTLVTWPYAEAGEWVRLCHLLWSHFGDKSQMSFTYSRSRDAYIIDYEGKKIYAVSYRKPALYFLKASFNEMPYLPYNWRPNN